MNINSKNTNNVKLKFLKSYFNPYKQRKYLTYKDNLNISGIYIVEIT